MSSAFLHSEQMYGLFVKVAGFTLTSTAGASKAACAKGLLRTAVSTVDCPSEARHSPGKPGKVKNSLLCLLTLNTGTLPHFQACNVFCEWITKPYGRVPLGLHISLIQEWGRAYIRNLRKFENKLPILIYSLGLGFGLLTRWSAQAGFLRRGARHLGWPCAFGDEGGLRVACWVDAVTSWSPGRRLPASRPCQRQRHHGMVPFCCRSHRLLDPGRLEGPAVAQEQSDWHLGTEEPAQPCGEGCLRADVAEWLNRHI